MHYHKNARTNFAQRKAIKENIRENNKELAAHYLVSPNTISKWKHSDRCQDHSSRPETIHYALSKDEARLIIKVRDHGLLFDERLEVLAPYIERLNKSNCYRTLLRYKLPVLIPPSIHILLSKTTDEWAYLSDHPAESVAQIHSIWANRELKIISNKNILNFFTAHPFGFF